MSPIEAPRSKLRRIFDPEADHFHSPFPSINSGQAEFTLRQAQGDIPHFLQGLHNLVQESLQIFMLFLYNAAAGDFAREPWREF